MKLTNIYTVYSDNKPVYVGKTNVLKDNKIVLKDLPAYKNNKKLSKKIRTMNNISVRIHFKPQNEPKVWYNEKLKRLSEHKEQKTKLVNSYNVWGLTKPFWKGKRRDKNTLKRLSESKFKPVLQYDLNGKFVKEWPSGRHVGKYYRDYEVINGAGTTKLYPALAKRISLYHNYYWFYKERVTNTFNGIPRNLPVEFYKPTPPPRKKVVRPEGFINSNSIAVGKYKNGKLVAKFNTLKEAAQSLRGVKYPNFILKCCNGTLDQYKGYTWKFSGNRVSKNKKFVNKKA